ncbi:RNA polymerase sigma-70 factor [uncultured Sunxiuqinia sp.]|uniref:RNA polymerase sigma-70 factor n=1 Tax=uncultured Sunxiuqinia sp. TaxID=1573825 RepID=UPI002AA6CB31|nr:RNA polymerase sigma-70 factor [uncultured Sunxiuqinia sp.]
MEAPIHIKLFKELASGDEDAFEKLYHLYFPRLYSFSYRIIQDSGVAKDIVQNVFIRLWEIRETFAHEQPESFLYKMVRNASLNYIRHIKVVDNLKEKVKDQFQSQELYYIDMVGNEPYVLIEKELQDQILEVMDSLPEKCGLVFRKSRVEGLKNKEIAEQLGMSLKNVEKHISKALTVYRNKFSGYLPIAIILLVLKNLK